MTVTLNPAVDRTLWVPGFAAGRTRIVEKSETVSGGKGVNVSRALSRLGIGSVATGLIARGGADAYLERLDREGLAHDFVFIEGTVRTNVTILSDDGEEETHLREKGPRVPEAALAELEEKIRSLVRDGASARGRRAPALVVISGSLPEGLAVDTYRRLVARVREAGAVAALDASGAPLRAAVDAGLFLVKPNAREVEDSLGFFPSSPRDLRRAVYEFARMGVDTAMISLGREGLVLSREGRSVHASVRVCRAVNAVGSGDAALAGGIAGILGGLSPQDTARLACAAGAANTLVSGACVFNPRDIETLLEAVEVRPL